MNVESFREYCLAKKGVEEAFPFDEVTLVFKVMGKMFALTGLDSEHFTINLKCDPEWSEELREVHPEIQPGYHMSKVHWNTVDGEGALDDAFLCRLIDHSYEQVVKGLPQKVRETLQND